MYAGVYMYKYVQDHQDSKLSWKGLKARCELVHKGVVSKHCSFVAVSASEISGDLVISAIARGKIDYTNFVLAATTS